MNKPDIITVLGEVAENFMLKSTITTVDDLQTERFRSCIGKLGLEEGCYKYTIYDVMVFAKIHILFESGLITEEKFYSLSDAYVQYLCVRKEYGRILNIMDETLMGVSEKDRLISLKNEMDELKEEFNKYMLLDFEMDIYKIISHEYLLKFHLL